MTRPPSRATRACLSLSAVVAACADGPAATADATAARPAHHRDGTYQNRYVEFVPRGFPTLMRWKLAAARDGLPPPPSAPIPTVQADLATIRANAAAGGAMRPAATWIGHATVLVQAGGLNVLTDPMFSERASPLSFAGPKRAVPPAIAAADLPRIDVVLISHNHYDHLDEASVRALDAQPGGPPLFLVPLGLKAWLADAGITNAVELDWWQVHRVAGTDFVLTPVQHWSGRGVGDRMRTLWGGWAVLHPTFHWYFAGDTGYSKDFADIAAHFADRQRDGGFDLALLPVGAYEPRWFMSQQHVNPAEAVQLHRDLRARRSLGIHWGTFALTDEALDEPPRALAAALREAGVAADHFVVAPVGATTYYSVRR